MTQPAASTPRWLSRVAIYLKGSWRSHVGTVLMALLAFVAVNTWQTRHVPSGPAPEFISVALLGPGAAPLAGLTHGTELSLAQWRDAFPGQAVAIHIWSDWCPFCKMEESSVTRVAADWPVLTVASRSGQAAQVARYMVQRQLPWVAVVDPAGAVSKAYGLSAVPAWVVLDAQGHIRSVATGYTTELGMRARLWWATVF